MRKSLAGDIAKARSAQDFSRVDQLKRLRSEVNREVERLAAEGGPAAGRAKEAIRYDREEFAPFRSEEHTSELQSLMRISYAVFCLKKKKQKTPQTQYKIAHQDSHMV